MDERGKLGEHEKILIVARGDSQEQLLRMLPGSVLF